ncbi:hypothetical protein LCGC14_0978060 [marine sediment metagenome]|uniref:HTH cro/C1-type domain-containing protein n=1 Tax=marine sediment metagenome TaxID=412755 RepID=A0A0F9RG23_9ZZZZ
MAENMGDRVLKLRKRLGLTQQDIADLLGTTPQHISRLEKGFGGLGSDLLVRMAQELGVTTDYLLTGIRSTEETIRNSLLGGIRRDMASIRKALEELRHLQ